MHAEVRLAAGDPEGAYAGGADRCGGWHDSADDVRMADAAGRSSARRSGPGGTRTPATTVEEVLATLDALFEQFPHVDQRTAGRRPTSCDDSSERWTRCTRAEGARARADVDAGDRVDDRCGSLRGCATPMGGGVLVVARGGGAARPRPRSPHGCGDAPPRPRAGPAAPGAAGRGRAARPGEARTDPDRGAGSRGIRRAGRPARPDRPRTGGPRPHRRRPHVRRDRSRAHDQREDREHPRLAPAGQDRHRQPRRARTAGPPRDDGSRRARPASRRCGPRRGPRRTPPGAA